MTIHELNALTALTSTDEVPVWDAEASGEPTKKITAQKLASSVKTLAHLQDALTFDSAPTTGSTNPVTSGGTAAAIAQSTANIVHFLALNNQTISDNALTTYELASYLPSGYTLWSVIVTIKSGNIIYQLPYIDGSGKSTYVQRVNGTTITISNTVNGWPTTPIYVTAFLKRN